MRWYCLILIFLAANTIACQATLYDWGTYEASILKMYSSRENFSAAGEIDRLQKEVERTHERNRLLPPGKMAHLGYLYVLMADSESARRCFEAEKELFPESEHFMDFLLAKLE